MKNTGLFLSTPCWKRVQMCINQPHSKVFGIQICSNSSNMITKKNTYCENLDNRLKPKACRRRCLKTMQRHLIFLQNHEKHLNPQKGQRGPFKAQETVHRSSKHIEDHHQSLVRSLTAVIDTSSCIQNESILLY